MWQFSQGKSAGINLFTKERYVILLKISLANTLNKLPCYGLNIAYPLTYEDFPLVIRTCEQYYLILLFEFAVVLHQGNAQRLLCSFLIWLGHNRLF